MPTYAMVTKHAPRQVVSLFDSPLAADDPFLVPYGLDQWPIDVTSLSPQPQPGWSYDGVAFTEPGPMRNRRQIMAKMTQMLQRNQDFLAIQTPTNAQVVQAVQALTREVTMLIRIVADQLDTTDGT